jgi:hypothetical protein
MFNSKYWLLQVSLLGHLTVGLAPSLVMAQVSTVERSAGSGDSASSTEERLKELVRKGIAAYRAGDNATARAMLSDAVRIRLVPSVVALLADIETKMERFRDAAEHWTIYLSIAPENETKARAEAEEQVKLCLNYVGSMRVSIQPAEAVLWVDGEPVDLAQTKGTLWLNTGLHTLQIKSGERSSEIQESLIRKGENLPLHFVLPPAPIVPTQSAVTVQSVNMNSSPPRETGGLEARTIALLTGGVLTLAAAGVGTAYWVKNSNAKDDAATLTKTLNASAEGTADTFSACHSADASSACSELKSKNDDMRRSADISDYSFVAAGVLGVLTVSTYLFWPTAHTRSESTTGLVLAPWWSPKNQGFAAQWSF